MWLNANAEQMKTAKIEIYIMFVLDLDYFKRKTFNDHPLKLNRCFGFLFTQKKNKQCKKRLRKRKCNFSSFCMVFSLEGETKSKVRNGAKKLTIIWKT